MKRGITQLFQQEDPLFYEELLSQTVKGIRAFPPAGSWNASTSASCIRLHLGYASPASIPGAGFLASAQDLFSQEKVLPFQYTGSKAVERLQMHLSQYCASRKMEHGDLIVTCGATQAIELSARILLNQNDPVAVEAPTYMSALEVFRTYTSRIISYPTDKDGLMVEQMQMDCAYRRRNNLPLPKILYIIPSFHNPTGNTLSLERRKALLALAEEYRFLILEDDAYGELYFEDQLPTLQSLDQGGRVIYLGSLSKTIAPGIRVGWAFGPPPLIRAMHALDAERINPLSWALTTCYLERIDYRHRLAWLRTHYASRCQCMLQSLAQTMPSYIQWNQPQGGYFLWLTLQEAIDTRQLLPHALEQGVSFAPGCYFYHHLEHGQSQLRLSFSWLSEHDIRLGIERLKQAIISYVSSQ